jgi:mannose-6-phosphate isomerase-like protein (cupin superfamily)
MNSDKKVLLTEYILGNIDLNNNPALLALLKDQNTAKEIESLRQTLEVFTRVAPLNPSKKLRETILKRIAKASSTDHQLSGFRQRLSEFYKLSLSRIDEILQATKTIEPNTWDQKMLPGASLLHFNGGEGLSTADCGLIHLTPGNGIGKHSHNGDEWMFVLKGYLRCSDNNYFKPGDIIHRTKGTEHSVKVEGKQDCIFAVIADHGVTFF